MNKEKTKYDWRPTMKKNVLNMIISVVVVLAMGCNLIGCSSNAVSNATSKDIATEYHDQQYWKDRFKLEEYHPNEEITDDNYDKNVAVKCKNGTFVGLIDDDVKTWKGIPFAKQPVEDLRFMAPQDAEESDKVFEAKYFGHSCIQLMDKDEKASQYEQGEDCLYLNVWSSTKNTNNKKPVLIYIHGGGWAFGGGADPMYDGHLFAHYNPEVVIVTIQYRSGILGQINFNVNGDDGNLLFEDGASDDYKGSTSNGLRDMIKALKWVNENIRGFGGDPENVTISGESAGAGACSALVTIDEAKKYFQKAIIMSGGVNQSYSIEQTYNLAKSIKDYFNNKGKNINSVKDLQKIPSDEMKEFVTGIGMADYTYYVRDGIVMNSDIYGEFESGKTTDITILTGSTTNEFKYYDGVLRPFDEASGYTYGTWYNMICEAMTNHIYNNAVKNGNEEFIKAYNEYVEALKESGYTVETTTSEGKIEKTDEFYNEFMNDYYLAGINFYQAYLHTQNGGKAYAYSFDVPYNNNKAYELASHAVDCYYLFGNMDGKYVTGNNAQVDASREYQKMITAFCLNGNPSTDRYQCKPYEVGKSNTVVIGLEPNTYFTEDYQTRRFNAVNKMYDNSDGTGYRFILSVPDMTRITLEYFSGE